MVSPRVRPSIRNPPRPCRDCRRIPKRRPLTPRPRLHRSLQRRRFIHQILQHKGGIVEEYTKAVGFHRACKRLRGHLFRRWSWANVGPRPRRNIPQTNQRILVPQQDHLRRMPWPGSTRLRQAPLRPIPPLRAVSNRFLERGGRSSGLEQRDALYA